MTRDPSAHAAHEMPLADRIVDDLIGDYIRTAADTARAANGYCDDEAAGYAKAVDQMQHLYLSGHWYRLTPRILDALRRAGLLIERPDVGHRQS